MIAPQPFLEERGAPFAIYHHIKALLHMGHTVDLVTYYIGKPVNLPGLRIFRISSIPGIHQIKVGPSMVKFPLDLLVFCLTFWRLCIMRYDCLHTHEEAGIIGVLLGYIFGRKHLYYMHGRQHPATAAPGRRPGAVRSTGRGLARRGLGPAWRGMPAS